MTTTPTLTPNNLYIGKTATEPRPTAKTWPWDNLPERQRLWDEADAWRQENERLQTARFAAVDAKERAGRERAAAAADARALARQAEIAADLRARFLAAGGTAGQFEREKDGLVLEAIKAATLQPDRAPGAGGTF